MNIALWMSVGVGIGTALGAACGDASLGCAWRAPLGAALGAIKVGDRARSGRRGRCGRP